MRPERVLPETLGGTIITAGAEQTSDKKAIEAKQRETVEQARRKARRDSQLTPKESAEYLYKYCVVSGMKMSEGIHNLYIIAEHYAAKQQGEADIPEDLQVIDKIPSFFSALTSQEKAEFCYHQVISALSPDAYPVTVESLRATKRRNLDDPWSSYAGAFVKTVMHTAITSLVIMAIAYIATYIVFIELSWLGQGVIPPELQYVHWFALGCTGALLHLLNHALTTTREQTFQVSEARKIGPRILLGGMLGVIMPWVVAQLSNGSPPDPAVGSVTAVLSGYSVRFSIAFLERLLSAVLPETKNTPRS